MVVIALMTLFCLCACESESLSESENETYATVYFSDGTTETFEVGEIPAMVRENQYAYNNKYAGNTVEIVTTVTDIQSNYGMAGFVPINFEGGWDCFLKEDIPVILDLREGTLVKVKGTLTTNSWSVQGASVTIIE